MSKSSVDSTIDEQDGRDQDDRDKSSAKIMKRLKALFCFCFKREPRAGEIVEYDPDEYDYIVEKLVVRRVPLAFFAIAADLQDLRRQTPSMSSQSTSSSTVSWSKPTVNVVTQATSTRSVIDRTAYDFTANKALRFDTDGNRVPIMKRQEEAVRCELNTHLFGFASKKNEKSRMAGNSRQLQDPPPSGKLQNNFIIGWSRRHVMSPFRVNRGSFDLVKPQDTIGDAVNGKSLERIEESLENRFANSAEDPEDRDSRSKATVRWRVTVRHRYKSRICSCASVIAFLFIVLSFLTPFFIISNAGGVWMKNRVHTETPDVHFNYKYLLLAEKDTLKFEAHFYTDKPVKSLRLLLFFNFKLKHLIQTTIESIGVFDQVLSHETQEIRFFGDLELRQKGLLHSAGLYETYNETIELSNYTLPELLLHNFYRKCAYVIFVTIQRGTRLGSCLGIINDVLALAVSARIMNERVTWRSGFSRDEAVVVIGELFYAENLIYYQPSVWEELKWAWIQYLSCLLVFAYVTRHVLVYLFSNRYLNTYIQDHDGALIMSTKSKEKVVAAIRKLFRSSDKIAEQEGASGSTGSPSRRLLNRHHRPDAITPADGPLPENPDGTHVDRPCFFKAKKSTKENECKAACDVGLRRLMKEFNRVQRAQRHSDSAFTAELVNDNVFEWFVRLHKIDPDSKLAADMRELKIPHILLHVVFPKEFPFAPPFMRVISPRIEQGFVMHGGAICMELLTPRGWCCAYSVESMIMQFAASVVKGQAQVARKSKPNKEYNRQLAEESFKSLVRTHEKYGWVTPPLAEG
ncbi:hypothetical protein DMN91_006342 [Ooceraea biroi]|uniref:Transmembrane protein 231 n=1 Tax=Ooceraea biroi TaxID=2015173 RepID=A0A3L8DP05_OOCBI|nr:hypothetical protein DMN91_006342 [Ooceraea biroi]